MLYLWTDCEDLGDNSMFYMLLHVIAMLALINTLRFTLKTYRNWRQFAYTMSVIIIIIFLSDCKQKL